MPTQDLGPGNTLFALAFVVIMMVVAALVSAAADRMGHRAARRKLRIGNLRPRHVSTLIAIISGVLISLVTVGLMFLVWKDFYRALTQWDNLNGRLVEVQAQTTDAETARDKALADKQQAESDLTAARGQIASQSVEIRQKVTAIAETREKLAGAQSKLSQLIARRDTAQRDLQRAQREAAKAIADKESTEFELGQKQELVRSAQMEFERLDRQVQEMRTEIERSQTALQLYGVGEQLGVVRVNAGASIEDALQTELAEIKTRIEAQGLEFDPQSRDKVVEFLDALPDDSSDYLVQIVAAENVFQGGQVLLDFNYRELAPLVAAGTAVLDITIYDTRAVITGLEGVRQEVTVPAVFDRESLIDFVVSAQNVFTRGALTAGFIADDRGEIASPVGKLTDVADELVTRARPIRIQFVSKRSATALEASNLADAELHLTSSGRIERAPEAAPVEPPVDDAAAPNEAAPAPETEGNDAG